MSELSVFDVFEYLPGINCKNCGENNCMAFAEKLLKGQKTLAACAPLREDIYKKRKEQLMAMLKV